MTDVSLDIASTICKIIHDGKIIIEFCANIYIVDGKADTVYSGLVNWPQSIGVNIKRVSSFGNDGAFVMTGRHFGIGTRRRRDNSRIIHVWCAAHRVALVPYWSAKKTPYRVKAQSIDQHIHIL